MYVYIYESTHYTLSTRQIEMIIIIVQNFYFSPQEKKGRGIKTVGFLMDGWLAGWLVVWKSPIVILIVGILCM